MSETKEKKDFVMKQQDTDCTFSTFSTLLKKARTKAADEGMSLKMIVNAGLIIAVDKSKQDIQNIIKKAGYGGEI